MEALAVVQVADLKSIIAKMEQLTKELRVKNAAPEGFINIEEAAKWFGGVHKDTIINWAENGTVKGHKVEGSRRWLFKYSELAESVKSKDELNKYKVRL